MQSVFPNNILSKIKGSLHSNYSLMEAESLAYLILEEVFGLSKTAILMNEAITTEGSQEIDEIISRLLQHEPIQHILGYTEFFGRKFMVNEHVLIPRQETEELIQLIKTENIDVGLRVLDIGTGSGCIACSLAMELHESKVFALDVSEQALEIAAKNAEALGCQLTFLHSDILSNEISVDNLNIMVSNPPYVTEKEKSLMHPNVLDFEPALALFVADHNPLLFYDMIAKKSQRVLKNGGQLYFEINELFGKEVALLMEENQFKNVKIHQDLNGKDRFVSGIFQLI